MKGTPFAPRSYKLVGSPSTLPIKMGDGRRRDQPPPHLVLIKRQVTWRTQTPLVSSISSGKRQLEAGVKEGINPLRLVLIE